MSGIGGILAGGALDLASGLLSKGPDARELEGMRWDRLKWDPSRTKEGFELAGLNPLLAFQGGYTPPSTPALGDHFATSGSHLAQALQMNHEKELQETALSQENETLREALDDLANPSPPSHLDNHGAILPLPSEGTQSDNENYQGGSNASGDVVDLRVGDNSVAIDEGTTNAEIAEERYGEIGGALYGAIPLMMDLEQTFVEYMTPLGDEILSAKERRLKRHRPKARPSKQAAKPNPKKPKAPEWGTPEWRDHMRELYP